MNFALVNIKDFCNFEDFYWTVFRLRTLVIDRHVTQILLATLEAKKSGRNKVKSWKKFAQKRADIMQSFCWFDKSSSWNYDYFSIIIPSSISDCVVFVLSWIFNSSKICLQWKLTKIKAWINSWPRYYDLTLNFQTLRGLLPTFSGIKRTNSQITDLPSSFLFKWYFSWQLDRVKKKMGKNQNLLKGENISRVALTKKQHWSSQKWLARKSIIINNFGGLAIKSYQKSLCVETLEFKSYMTYGFVAMNLCAQSR